MNNKTAIPVQLSLAPNTHNRVRNFAQNIKCVSGTGNPKVASAVTSTLQVILQFYGDDKFQECLENEGIDALSFIQKCVNRGMKESLGEKNR